MTFEQLEQLVISWGEDKDLIKKENSEKQFMKFIEEVFEFKTEIDFREIRWDSGMDYSDIVESMQLEMGDILVTLIILSAQLGIDLKECLEMAYEKISKRKGKTINGIFVKEEDCEKGIWEDGYSKGRGEVIGMIEYYAENEDDIVKEEIYKLLIYLNNN